MGRKTRSLRKKSGKKAGGQLGHRGETLRLVPQPDEVVEHRPHHCPQCQTPLADADVVLRERRQVHELPPGVRLQITEHQALQVRCPTCAHTSVGAFAAQSPSWAQYGAGVRALAVYLVEQQQLPLGCVQQLLSDLWRMRLGRGTLVSWIGQAARVLAPLERQIKTALVQASVLHHDETGVRRALALAWAHVTSTSRLTHYAIHRKRGREALEHIGILPDFRGVTVHDGWGSYRAYTACRHALCNDHHLREVTFLEEQCQQTWAADMEKLLRERKAATDHARTSGCACLPPGERTEFVGRYHALLAFGLAANPPPAGERRAGQRDRIAQSPTRNLLERLHLQQDQVLAFLDDFTIPFDNNQAERDLRGLKIQRNHSRRLAAAAGQRAPRRASALFSLRGRDQGLGARCLRMSGWQHLTSSYTCRGQKRPRHGSLFVWEVTSQAARRLLSSRAAPAVGCNIMLPPARTSRKAMWYHGGEESRPFAALNRGARQWSGQIGARPHFPGASRGAVGPARALAA